MEEQKGDENPGKFSFTETKPLVEQKSCYITYTNRSVHEILKTGFGQSPMFAGRIQGVGPRYCPSIEDKINRFAERERHQIFVEPEGWNTVEVYVNGFSTSLPENVQYNALTAIEGFEKVKMFRPGYAIEYDYFPPTQLKPTLETKIVENLFFAGQINGTTGYEEAASQGLMAGINAHNLIFEKDPFILKRSEAYIGVLIDDLINKGTKEPYRMFTSRAEYRILLRQNNADIRLTEKSYQLGLADKLLYNNVLNKKKLVNEVIKASNNKKIQPQIFNNKAAYLNSSEIKEKTTINKLLKRPELSFMNLIALDSGIQSYFSTYSSEIIEEAEILIKYETYIDKERKLAEKIENLDDLRIPDSFEYKKLISLSSEGMEKLRNIQPVTIGQASRISGVSPADISILMVYLGK
jgi:tRNA uridine 5-carboxymethylaminomethyl modification enzyme